MTQLVEATFNVRSGRPTRIVDNSDLKVSSEPRDVLVTYSLGSCVGLTLYDTEARVGGLIHCMLPLSQIDPARALTNPYMFVDTGVTAMLNELFTLGAQRKNLVARVAGAGGPLGNDETYRIGQRNHAVLSKLLQRNNIPIDREDVGGTKTRTLLLYMEDGLVTVRSDGKEVPL